MITRMTKATCSDDGIEISNTTNIRLKIQWKAIYVHLIFSMFSHLSYDKFRFSAPGPTLGRWQYAPANLVLSLDEVVCISEHDESVFFSSAIPAF